ncbi:Protein of unknown function [Pyronema omphalodes CBS 100304]|uniref:Uncharacterized protein n=1 Tax=Pyronema omphalodes (strain CBS 100304) TaxID=1076935 RepID=U4L9F0_PYROM|nr:Protein of unknown function [Pyronema omphalodes CBS 100304]
MHVVGASAQAALPSFSVLSSFGSIKIRFTGSPWGKLPSFLHLFQCSFVGVLGKKGSIVFLGHLVSYLEDHNRIN